MKPLAIIGLDPGTTSAYIILDLEGKIISANSGKELTLAKMLAEITQLCQPIFVSTDKAKIPSFVEQFARKVGAEIIFPKSDLKKEDKRNSCEPFNEKLDAHQQDCLAAAVFAYRRNFPRFMKIIRYIDQHKLYHKKEEFMKLALTKDVNFTIIKDLLTRRTPETKIMDDVISEKRITKTDFERLYTKLTALQKEKQHLENKILFLNQQLSSIRKKNLFLHTKSTRVDQTIHTLFQFKEKRLNLQQKEIQEQQNVIASLHEDVSSLNNFIGKTTQFQLVKRLQTFSQHEFARKKDFLHIVDNDLLFVQNPAIYSEQVITMLEGRGIVIMSPLPSPAVISKRFQTLIFPAALFVGESEHFALAERKEIAKNINAKHINSADYMEKIIIDYQKKREVI